MSYVADLCAPIGALVIQGLHILGLSRIDIGLSSELRRDAWPSLVRIVVESFYR